MSENQVNKEAYKQAEEQLLKENIERIKGYILETLKKIDAKKKAKELVEEELRILKLDLEDLRNGKFDKIEERISKSPVAKHVSVQFVSPYVGYDSITTNTIGWSGYTSGTYNTGTTVYYLN